MVKRENGGRRGLRRVETVVRVYCMREESFQFKKQIFLKECTADRQACVFFFFFYPFKENLAEKRD